MSKLDTKRDYATISGDEHGRKFEQDGKFFKADHTLWRDPSKKETAQEKADREAAEKAEAERLAAEEEARKKAEGGNDDQLSKQLGS